MTDELEITLKLNFDLGVIIKLPIRTIGALLIAVAVAAAATLIADSIYLFSSHPIFRRVSPVAIAFIVGVLLSPWFQKFGGLEQGLRQSFRFVLQAGVILIGFRLSLGEAFKIGVAGLPQVILIITCAAFVNYLLGKILKVSKTLNTLIVVGTSICGLSAILTASSLLKPKQEELNQAIMTVMIFGSISFLGYPYLANAVFGSAEWQVGLFLGTAIHDTAQVASAALMHQQVYNSETVLEVAAVTKMLRNLSIIFVLPLIALSQNTTSAKRRTLRDHVPLFIVLFIVAVGIRTLGDLNDQLAFGFLPAGLWWRFLEVIDAVSTFSLTTATAALGVMFRASAFIKMGFAAFTFGLICALNVGLISALILSAFTLL